MYRIKRDPQRRLGFLSQPAFGLGRVPSQDVLGGVAGAGLVAVVGAEHVVDARR
jgi:hypothetical protein